jgi:2,4'-dihydroxyacetophenone dioxygenase
MCGCFIWGLRSGAGWCWRSDGGCRNEHQQPRRSVRDLGEGEGKWSLPIQVLPDDAGWVELMRLSPGTRLGLHRHTGEVHALTLAGERRLNDGRVVRPGDYIHEPAGSVDWWEATGTETLLVHVVVKGRVEYLGPRHTVL